MYYKELLSEFEKENIEYLLVGGVSVTMYGVPRMTQDIDFIISTEKENVQKVLEVLKHLEYKPRLPVNPELLFSKETVKEWIEERNLIAFSFNHKTDIFKTVDILLVHNLDFNTAYKNRNEIKVWNMKVNLVSVDDLISMKEFSGRKKDLDDVILLKKIFGR